MMKKALQISIAQTLFTIEDDAYARLEGYLASVKTHFKHTGGADEIIADIESRIAEQLHESKDIVVTQDTVEKVLAQMGKVEDFDDMENAHSHTHAREEKGPLIGEKRLYRNPDDKFIAGVCSGLAAYFGIEPLWIRLGFVIASFFSGLGVIIYIVLWIVLPEAKTGGQKLEMSGTPVNLSTISETVRERVAEIPVDRSRFSKLVTLPFRILGKVITLVFNIMGPLLRFAVGLALIFGSFALIMATFVSAGFFLPEKTVLMNDVPLDTLAPGALHWLLLWGITFAVLIPLLFVMLSGLSLLRKKILITGASALGLLGTWFLALLICGFGVASVAGNYQRYIDASPTYQMVEQPIVIMGALSGPIDTLTLSGGIDVDIVQSTSTSLIASGRAKDITGFKAHVENGALIIEHIQSAKSAFCMFCFSQTPRLTLRIPSIANISATNGSSVRSDNFTSAKPVQLTLEHGSYGNLVIKAPEMKVITTNGSRANLKGDVRKVTAILDHGSLMTAQYLSTDDTDVSTYNGSHAEINAVKNLKVTANYGSTIIYFGNAKVTESADRSSSIRSSNPDQDDTAGNYNQN